MPQFSLFLLLVNGTYPFSCPNQNPADHPQFLTLACYAISHKVSSISYLSSLAMPSLSLSQVTVVVLELVFLSPICAPLYCEVKRSLESIALLQPLPWSSVDAHTYTIRARYLNMANTACPDLAMASFLQ